MRSPTTTSIGQLQASDAGASEGAEGDRAGLPAARFRLLSLGNFQLLGPEGPVDLGSRKLCGLVSLLACNPGRPLSRERLMAMLWGSHFEAQAQQNLRQALARLRRTLGRDVLDTSDHLLSLHTGMVDCDLPRFEALIREGSRGSLSTAADLYEGRFLADVSIKEPAWTDWIDTERSRLETLAVDALVRLAEEEIAAGSAERAVAAGQRAIGIDELREDGHRVVIKGLAATGRRAEALRHFEQLAALLLRVLKVEPDQATRAVVAELRAGGTVPETAKASDTRDERDRPQLARIAALSFATDMQTILVAAAQNGEKPSHGRLLEEACRQVSPRHDGRVIGTRDDSLLLQFPNVRAATSAGFAIMRTLGGSESGPSGERPPARMGLHVMTPLAMDQASYREGLEVAHELSARADRGEIVASAAAREHITPVVDAEVEDLGEWNRTGRSDPIRGYRISSPTHHQLPKLIDDGGRLWPTVAIIPFLTLSDEPRHRILGEILADEIIAGLSHNSEVTVISRLSTTALRGRDMPLSRMRSLLNATYVLSGTCHVAGDHLRLTLEFADARSDDVIWADSLTARISEFVTSNGIVDDVIARLCAGIMQCEGARARTHALPTLENSTLLLGAVALMHQLSRPNVEIAREMLETLIERAPSHPMPHAWLAHLYSLRSNQGWTYNFETDAELALDSAKRALDAEPNCSLALAVDGYVHTHFLKRFDLAADRFDLAVGINPNDSLAWLLKATMHAFMADGAPAVESADRALRLSPLDPRRWYYDSLAATAAVAAADYPRAIDLAERSLRGNRTHTSTFRALAIAQCLAGKVEDARRTVTRLMLLQPHLTVTEWRQRHPSSAFQRGELWAGALRQAGVPE